MSEIKTWAVKMPEEMKEKIQSILDEHVKGGLQGKDMMETFIQLYETNQMKEEQPLIKQDIEELEVITRRIINIYASIGERITTTLNDKDRDYSVKLDTKQDLIIILQNKLHDVEQNLKDLQQENKQLQEKLDNDSTVIVKLESEYKTKVNQFEELNQRNKALIEEYKAKNDTLTGLVSEYKQYKEDIQRIKSEKEALDKSNMQLTQELNKLNAQDENLKKDMNIQVEKFNIDIQQLHEQHKEELEQLKNVLSFERDKELLERDRQYIDQIQLVREEYNNKIKNILEQMQR